MASVTFTPRALEGCALRPFRRGDEAALARHANSKAVWRHLRDRFPHPYTLEGRLRKSVVKDGKVLDQFLYAKVR